MYRAFQREYAKRGAALGVDQVVSFLKTNYKGREGAVAVFKLANLDYPAPKKRTCVVVLLCIFERVLLLFFIYRACFLCICTPIGEPHAFIREATDQELFVRNVLAMPSLTRRRLKHPPRIPTPPTHCHHPRRPTRLHVIPMHARPSLFAAKPVIYRGPCVSRQGLRVRTHRAPAAMNSSEKKTQCRRPTGRTTATAPVLRGLVRPPFVPGC